MPRAVAMSASAIPPDTAVTPPEPVAAIPSKAWMIPTTVPNRPMNGAVDPIVARPPSPLFMSARVRAAERSRARDTSSTRAPGSPTDS